MMSGNITDEQIAEFKGVFDKFGFIGDGTIK